MPKPCVGLSESPGHYHREGYCHRIATVKSSAAAISNRYAVSILHVPRLHVLLRICHVNATHSLFWSNLLDISQMISLNSAALQLRKAATNQVIVSWHPENKESRLWRLLIANRLHAHDLARFRMNETTQIFNIRVGYSKYV